jgi:WD40 repeat protein
MPLASLTIMLLAFAAAGQAGPPQAAPPDFEGQVAPILKRYCTGCHNANEVEGGLILESYAALRKGGKHGAVVVPGKSGESRLLLLVEGKARPRMPPGKRQPPAKEEIAVLRAWIEAGARGPAEARSGGRPAPAVPRIVPRLPPRRALNAIAADPRGELIALGRYGEVELVSALTGEPVKKLEPQAGTVTALTFWADGSRLLVAGGEPGLSGEARLYSREGELQGVFGGHRDCLYAAAVSPGGKLLATAGYDQEIRLWDVSKGERLKTLSGHNAAVFDLAFRPDGKVLASASGDRTVKLWDVASGARLETFSQPLKEVYTVAFSPDGSRLAAGGVDNRIRVWAVSAKALEGTNPILEARFAHEGAILKILYSPDGRQLLSSADDRTVKLWDAGSVKETRLLELQPDWPGALAYAPDGRTVVVGRLDGTLGFYSASSGRTVRLAGLFPAAARGLPWGRAAFPLWALLEAPPAAADPPAKPELVWPEPRGVQRGVPTRVKLHGKNLSGASEVKFHQPGVSGKLLGEKTGAESVEVEVTPAAKLACGPYELSVAGAAGESQRLKLWVDDLVQVVEVEPNDTPERATPGALPASFLGTFSTLGDADHFSFEARAGETLVLDLQTSLLGSKAAAILTLLDPEGRPVASENGFDDTGDPLLAYTVPRAGRYTVEVKNLTLAASPDHYYRLSAGSFPYVTGVYPLGIPAGAESEVELTGYNLPPEARVRLKAGAEGELGVVVDPERFRSREGLKVAVGSGPEVLEVEPNDRPSQATPIPVPGVASGRLRTAGEGRGADLDLFRFPARSGETLIIETEAARRGSPIDTRIEVLHLDGSPVARAVLQAVRDSYITFRGIDSSTIDLRVKNWEEMELNQLLYMQGEVGKIFRMPQGPDSGLNLYQSNGKRLCLFDTSATAHADAETCYIVEPHPPGSTLAANGLPVFTIYYQNDDDGERRLGRDSRLTFRPPADGDYLVRVSDVREQSGDRFAYRLKVRPARPDFRAVLNGANPSVGAGSAREFSVSVERIDGFEGEVRVEVNGLPPGFSVSHPLFIEAGHTEARGSLSAAADAAAPGEAEGSRTRVTATAVIEGKTITREVNNLGRIKLEPRPKLLVRLEPWREPVQGGSAGPAAPPGRRPPAEIAIAPGESIPALLRVERNGYDDLVTFQVDNLPHGVIVDNIGLNGVLIPKGQNERQIFLNAARWVSETLRPCHAVENQAGGQASPPVLLRVARPPAP